MAEFIGARISLVSNSDIRYVGTLHEINSETSTVALEHVSMLGTEGRRPDNEVPPSDSVYEYILFRGTDVKDLRIEQAPAAKENKPLQVPNDPAILGSGSRPTPKAQSHIPNQRQQQGQPQAPLQASQQGPQGMQTGPPPFGQHPQYPPFYPQPPNGWGRSGPPGPGGYAPMPYGGPPGWYPGPQQSFPPGPQFSPYGYPTGPPSGPHGPPGQFPPQQVNQGAKPVPIGVNKQVSSPAQHAGKHVEPNSLAKSAEIPAATTIARKAPTPPVATKPSPGEVKAAIKQPSTAQSAVTAVPPATKPTPTGPKINNRIQPVVPLQSPASIQPPLQSNTVNSNTAKPADPSASLRDATQAATAAVAAAMAKLPSSTNGNAVDHLTRKVNEMRTADTIRAPKQPGGANFGVGRTSRGPRGGVRTGAQKVEIPKEDYDFESANAKFSKEDLVKEAIAGSPLGESAADEVSDEREAPVYNKATSFFDNISSEAKDRQESGSFRPGGREWRGEEQKKNIETFGQGSVDIGHRGGYRGRGRGRGGFRARAHSGNGQPARGRGGYRGRGDAQAVVP